jgi:carboxyl-terminal processing protease
MVMPMSPLRFFSIVGGLAMLALTGFAQAPTGKPISADQKTEVLARLKNVIEQRAFVPNVDFTKWDGFVNSQQTGIDKASDSVAFGQAVQKALSEFGFSHFYFMTPDMVQSRMEHRVVGIGVMIAPDPKGVAVVRVYPGSPADKAGLVPGDLITKVDGQKADTTMIRGAAGTSVDINVEHADGGKDLYTIMRDTYSSVEPETLKPVDKNTAVLTIPTFEASYSPERVEGLMQQAAAYKNLIVDLRSDPGGEVINLQHLLGLMLPPKTAIGAVVGREDTANYQKDHPGPIDVIQVAKAEMQDHPLRVAGGRVPYYKGNIAVLINGGSGSAAEMAAAALHDLRSASVIGSKSAGALLFSTVSRLPDGFMVQYPLADYVTSAGARIEGHPIIPDFAEKDPRIPGRDKDVPMDRAVAIVEKEGSQQKSAS